MKYILLGHKVHSVKLVPLKIEVAVEAVFDEVCLLAYLFDDIWHLLALKKLSYLRLLKNLFSD
jgi:hypothetical protein